MSYVFRAELAQPVGLLPEQAGLTLKQQPVGEEPTEMPARSRDGGPGPVTSPFPVLNIRAPIPRKGSCHVPRARE